MAYCRKTQGYGNSLIRFNVKENVGYTPRSATLTIRHSGGSEKKVRVFQAKGMDLITSIPRNEIRTFSVFPNPIVSSYEIRTPIPAQTLTLFNSEGKKISELNPSISTYDASHLSSGVYYIIAVFKDGVEVKKIFKR